MQFMAWDTHARRRIDLVGRKDDGDKVIAHEFDFAIKNQVRRLLCCAVLLLCYWCAVLCCAGVCWAWLCCVRALVASWQSIMRR
jgi:hypothetical protein